MRSIVLAVAVALVGCSSSDTCSQDAASCADAGQGSCTGQCTPLGTGFDVMLWSGPPGATPPACPAFANGGNTPGFLDVPPSTVTCSPACSCAPSENECFLPSAMTAGSTACPSDGMPFEAPPEWSGTCSTMNPVASADSLTVDPPTLGQGTCTPSTPNVVTAKGGSTIAVTCQSLSSHFGDVPGECPSADPWCAYPNAPGFTVCTAAAPGSSCADLPGWPVQHTFFQASCNCACGPASGDFCTATVDAYADSTCSDEVGSVTLTSNDGPKCADVPAGSPLGSKEATVTYTPGMCAATLTPIASETLCCLK
jgi:hypothetical protein